jgi:DNA-binding response OmpR family regulator
MAALPRVLLVEDDTSIRRFVAMALEEMPITLVEAGSLAEAEAALAAGPVVLLISDLMLPDGSGMALLQALAADPARRAGARLAAFSAGISAERRSQLEALGVDEVIAKPASLAALEGCVQRALDGASAAAAPAAAETPAADVVERHFGGDRALYEAFSDACYGQFTLDLRQGDAAEAAGDLPALRRLAHSLKSVLQTLGHDEASRTAAALEALAAEGDRARAPAAWARLKAAVTPLAR